MTWNVHAKHTSFKLWTSSWWLHAVVNARKKKQQYLHCRIGVTKLVWLVTKISFWYVNLRIKMRLQLTHNEYSATMHVWCNGLCSSNIATECANQQFNFIYMFIALTFNFAHEIIWHVNVYMFKLCHCEMAWCECVFWCTTQSTSICICHLQNVFVGKYVHSFGSFAHKYCTFDKLQVVHFKFSFKIFCQDFCRPMKSSFKYHFTEF